MTCRACSGPLEEVLDLGSHYLPDFTEPGAPRGERHPLRLMLCGSCTLLQLSDVTPRSALYHERYGFRSGVNEAIRDDLASVVAYALEAVRYPRSWLDIACNDGTLMAAIPGLVRRTGIDPLSHLASEAARHGEVISNYFMPKYFRTGEFDIITSVSVFYDLPDPCEFARGVASVLDLEGAWVIQQNYAADMLRSNAVDNIGHEHVTYFSVRSLLPVLEQAGLEVNDVAYSAVNGGCMRTMVSHRGARPVLSTVADALAAEDALGLGEAATWRKWGADVRAELRLTREFLEAQAADCRTVHLYGASTRGGTILQMLGDDIPDLIVFAVERNPGKVGKVMAATGLPVISEVQMRAQPPDALLVAPWFFREGFIERERAYLDAGGRMVFPLPVHEVVTRS